MAYSFNQTIGVVAACCFWGFDLLDSEILSEKASVNFMVLIEIMTITLCWEASQALQSD
jgi:hypothetical protein